MENIKSNIEEYVNTLLETEDSKLGVNFIRNKKILEEYKENINGD